MPEPKLSHEVIHRMEIKLNKTYAIRVPCECGDGYAEIQWGIISAVETAYCNSCKERINLDKTLYLLKMISEYMKSDKKAFSFLFLSDQCERQLAYISHNIK